MSRLLYQAELPRRESGPLGQGSGITSPHTESNRRPSPYHGDALPTELWGPRALEGYPVSLPSAKTSHNLASEWAYLASIPQTTYMASTGSGWTANSIPDQTGRRILVTGANSGLGYVTALELARHGASVLMAVRDQAKGQDALGRIQTQCRGTADVSLVELDLADLANIRALVDQIGDSQLDVLINNAGIMAIPRQLTVDGFERQLGTNHLGHMALTLGLLPNLMASGHGGVRSRVVTVSSGAHRLGRINLDDLMGVSSYHPWRAYGQSKLANLLFTLELQRRLDLVKAPVDAYSAHPGYADTNLQSVGPAMRGDKRGQSMMAWANAKLAQPAEMGALPTLYAATESGIPAGAFIGPDGFLEQRGYPKVVSPNSAGRDGQMARELWDASEVLIGMSFDEVVSTSLT